MTAKQKIKFPFLIQKQIVDLLKIKKEKNMKKKIEDWDPLWDPL